MKIPFLDRIVDDFFRDFNIAFVNKFNLSEETDDTARKDAVRRVQAEISRLNTFKRAASGVTVSENTKAKHYDHQIYVTVDTPKTTEAGHYTSPTKEAVVIDISSPESVEMGIEFLRDKFVKAGKVTDPIVIEKIHSIEDSPNFRMF